MWSWELERRRAAREPEAQLGRVSIGGVQAAAEMGGERRWLNVCTPGGMSWRPAPEDKVLILQTGDGGAPCVLGVVQEQELEPGQLRLAGSGGCILLGEGVELTGSVNINGEGLEELIRRIVKEGSDG